MAPRCCSDGLTAPNTTDTVIIPIAATTTIITSTNITTATTTATRTTNVSKLPLLLLLPVPMLLLASSLFQLPLHAGVHLHGISATSLQRVVHNSSRVCIASFASEIIRRVI